VQELFDIQADCQVWLDNLPEALKDSTTAEHLREVCELDLSPLDAALPSKGFGRDRRSLRVPLPGFARSGIRCVGVSVRNICVGRLGDAAAHNSHKGGKHSQGKQPSS
jgi:hypothetical protein